MITRRGLFGALCLAPFVRKLAPAPAAKWTVHASEIRCLGKIRAKLQADQLAYERRAQEIDQLIAEAQRVNREAMASLQHVIDRGSAQILKSLPDV